MRWERGQTQRSERVAPTMMADYNEFMGDTDLSDQRRGNFTTQRKSKKWWHCLFYFSIDILMVCASMSMHVCMFVCVCTRVRVWQQLNAWSIYNWQNGTSMSQKLFQIEVARGLLNECEPSHPLCTPTIVPRSDDDEDSEDLLTPTATKVKPAERFVCKKEHMASISLSKKYKCVFIP